ncbi:hypothetical protein LDENG_00271760 [Lucifuga dentata]|nr:hypothetical protein LDENG_00271760 [Lucifuga dentata]
MASTHFALLFLWVTQDLASWGNKNIHFDSITVKLGESLTLNCTFNCSAGFLRGCWGKGSGCLRTNNQNRFCSVSLHLANVSAEDLKYNYSCYIQHTDDPKLPLTVERIVSLNFQAHTISPDWTVTPTTKAENVSLPAKPNDSTGGDITGIKVLATVTIAVAIGLAALAIYLCVNRNRQSWNGKGEPVVSQSGSPPPSHVALSKSQGSSSTPCERVTVRIPTPDNGSGTEVPYADIMITVRGVSTPELTQICYLTPGNQKQCWLDEPRCHMQASRSADRLHVHPPREVSRKMSTNSEYAIITYA